VVAPAGRRWEDASVGSAFAAFGEPERDALPGRADRLVLCARRREPRGHLPGDATGDGARTGPPVDGGGAGAGDGGRMRRDPGTRVPAPVAPAAGAGDRASVARGTLASGAG